MKSAAAAKRYTGRTGQNSDVSAGGAAALQCPPTRVIDDRPGAEAVGAGLIDPFYPGNNTWEREECPLCEKTSLF